MSFITCTLQGGLGNQLFQIATTIGQAKEHKIPFFIIENQFNGGGQCNHPKKYYETIYQKISKLPLPQDTEHVYYHERHFAYQNLTNIIEPLKEQGKGLIIQGYFQSEKYFEKYRDCIRELFTPQEGLINTIATQTNLFTRYPELHPFNKDHLKRCLIGVRRGDYAKFPDIHPMCTMDYYERAMDLMKADLYYIISDDIEWCKSNFIGPQYRFLDQPDDYQTFLFARLFMNYICGNSSFHWWVSYLSIYNDPMVITPKIHFGPAGPQDYQDYFRKGMIRL